MMLRPLERLNRLTKDTGRQVDYESILSRNGSKWGFLALVALFGIITVAAAAAWPALTHLDQRVAQWGYDQTYGHSRRTAFWEAASHYGQPFIFRIGLGVLALVQIRSRRWALAAFLVGVAVAENVIAPLAKYVLDRPRPQWSAPITVDHGFGYPSGHSAGAAMFVVAVTLLLMVEGTKSLLRSVLIVAVVLLGLVVALSRIMLGLHFFSDVVAGAALGGAVALAGWWLLLRFGGVRLPPE